MGQHSAAFGLVVGALALCAIASGWFPLTRPILLAEGLSALALGMLGWQWRRISSHAVRVTADVLLLTPLLLLFVGKRSRSRNLYKNKSSHSDRWRRDGCVKSALPMRLRSWGVSKSENHLRESGLETSLVV